MTPVDEPAVAPERRPRWRRATRTGLRVAMVLVVGLPLLVAASGGAAISMLLFGDLPGTVPAANPQIESRPSYVYDANGDQIGQFRRFDLTVPMTKEDVPQVLKDAVVAAEDRKFWSHQGVDPEGIIRAATAIYREGKVVQGASTITQQYARLMYLTQDVTLSRKLNEAVLATRLEREMADELGSVQAAKEEILYRYLDLAYYGAGAYGAGAAAETYFRKSVRDLTLSEAATLVGVLPSPSTYGPRDDLAAAESRRQEVLRSMLEVGATTRAQFDEAMAAPLWLISLGEPADGQPVTAVYPPEDATAAAYPYFVAYVRDELEQRYGYTEEKIFRGGLRIETTLNPHLQGLAEAAVAKELEGTEYPLEMSLVSVEPSTGHVVAFVGGRDYAVNQVNLGSGGTAGFQAGSSFKVFTVAAALENGFAPDRGISGGPFEPPGCVSRDPSDCVLSGAGGAMGSVLASSSNAAFARLILDVGPGKVAELAHRLGVSRLDMDDTFDYTLTLGSKEVSPLDMAAGFATLANHGIKHQATPILRVLGADGQVLVDNTAARGEDVLDAAIADTTTQLMRGVVEGGTGTRAAIGRPVAGKTGTADDYRAAWFVGYTPQLATAVWMGNAESPQPMVRVRGVTNVGGGTIPAAAWARFMRPAHEGLPVVDFAAPGPLPQPSAERGVRAPGSRDRPSELPADCGGPCVRLPALTEPRDATAPPSPGGGGPAGATTTTTPRSSTTTTTPRATTTTTVPRN